MGQRIRFFGGNTRGQITLEDGESKTLTIDRDVWFDRDIDGRWLVWAGQHHAGDAMDGNDETGAMVVKDPRVVAFIDLLAQLIANPARFRDEPTFPGPPERDGA